MSDSTAAVPDACAATGDQPDDGGTPQRNPCDGSVARRRTARLVPRWGWVWNNYTQRAVPVPTEELTTVRVSPWLNASVCGVLRESGLAEKPIVSRTDLLNITGLLNFSWSDDKLWPP